MYKADLKEILRGQEVTLQEMLDAREGRAFRQKKILSHYNITIISFTLNIPGSVKAFPLAEMAFKEGKKLISRHLKRNNINIIHEEKSSKSTGYEACFAVDSSPYLVKRLMVDIENGLSIGRIFDIDVLNANGKKISRQEIGSDVRMCLMCREPAHVCSRSRKHSARELVLKTVEIMYDYFSQKFASMCSSCACRALMYEVSTTPKPGLVDRVNNGSHSDMDIYTFIDSSAVLTSYFRDFVLVGIEFYYDEPLQLFERIRYLGVLAEDAMLKATYNVNTHKGLIFSMGVICTSLGYLFAHGKPVDTESILNMSKIMTSKSIDDFKKVTPSNARTYGEKLYASCGIKGIRGEAAGGFISVRKYGLPVLKHLIGEGFSLNDAGALTLLNLIANVKDTNIISRSDIDTLVFLQKRIGKLIEEKGIENISPKELSKIDRKFISMNVSPGGCADLLAITYMLYFLENCSDCQ